jgi:hypothetical protein
MRWPWTGREPADDDLNARVLKLERVVTSLQLEWADVVDKLLHRISRQSKRDRDAAKAALDPTPEFVTGPPSPTQGGGRDSRLAAIRARHAALRGTNGRP